MKTCITAYKNVNFIEIDGERYLPAAFRSFRPTPANVSLFHRAGVRLYQTLVSGGLSSVKVPYSNYGAVWVGDGKYDFSAFDRQMKMFRRFAPEGYLMVMVQLDTPQWWLKEYPDAADSYKAIGEALFSGEWVEEATAYLKAFLEYAQEQYGDFIFSYGITAGNSNEWFNFQEEISETKKRAFAEYAGSSVKCPNSYKELNSPQAELLAPDDSRVRYRQFAATLVPKLICHFAHAAREVIGRDKLFSVFYGYIDMPTNWQNRTDTNGYEEVWKCPDIDILLSPAAYGEARKLDGASSYQYAVDSIGIHHKLYVHEIDHRTYLAGYPLENFVSCYEKEAYETEYETVMVLRRELCAAMCKNGMYWWFDFFGGYYSSPLLEHELEHQLKILERVCEREYRSVSEIAVFVDPMSFLYLPDNTGITQTYVRHMRNELHFCGAPYDFFNLKDITEIDVSQYKMFLFLNAFDMGENVQKVIRERLAGKTKVWIHAPNCASGHGSFAENISDITGIQVKEFSVDYTETILCDGIKFGFGQPMRQLYEVTDPDAEVLGSYETQGGTAMCRKGQDVYIGTGNVPADILRRLASEAGVHIYSQVRGALYADARFVAFQTMLTEKCELTFPRDCQVEELFDGGRHRTEDGVLRYTAQKGRMKLFLITG